MRTPQIWLLTFAILALAVAVVAEDGAGSGEARPVASPVAEGVGAPSSIGQEIRLSDPGRLTLNEELALDTPMTLASDAPDEGFGGGCYIGCLDATSSQNICGPGKVAEALVTGPINNCGLADITCKTTCSGPIVRCRYFALCNL